MWLVVTILDSTVLVLPEGETQNSCLVAVKWFTVRGRGILSKMLF